MEKLINFIVSVFIGLLMTHCQRVPPINATKNVFGQDNRRNIDDPAYPYSAIGRLESGCSAVLVGNSLVLTAAHCVVDNYGHLKPNVFEFRMHIKDGEAAIKATGERAWYGTNNPEDYREKDWAFIKLSTPIGQTNNWLTIDEQSAQRAELPLKTALPGYQNDRNNGGVLSVDDNCEILKRDGLRLFNNCDSASGISGAPVLSSTDEHAKVIAIAVSEYRRGADDTVHRDEYTEDYANIAISAEAFAPTWQSLRSSVDVGRAAPVLADVYTVDKPQTQTNPNTNPTPAPDTRATATLQWGLIKSFPMTMLYGPVYFDLGFANSLNADVIKAEFSPEHCAQIADFKLNAVNQPESDLWEEPQWIEGHTAQFASGSIRFLRLKWSIEGQAPQRCQLKLYAAATAQMRTVEPPASLPAQSYYCSAAPYDNPSEPYGYYIDQSQDEARYRALDLCTTNFGPVCTVRCRLN